MIELKRRRNKLSIFAFALVLVLYSVAVFDSSYAGLDDDADWADTTSVYAEDPNEEDGYYPNEEIGRSGGSSSSSSSSSSSGRYSNEKSSGFSNEREAAEYLKNKHNIDIRGNMSDKDIIEIANNVRDNNWNISYGQSEEIANYNKDRIIGSDPRHPGDYIIINQNTEKKSGGSVGSNKEDDPDEPHNTIRRDHDPIGKTRIIETNNPSSSSSDKSNPDPPKDPDPPKVDPPKPPTPPPYPGDKITIHPPSGCPNYLTWTETTYEYVGSSNSWRPVNHGYKVEFTTDVTLEDAKNNDLKASKTLKAGYGIKVGTNTTYEVKQTSGPSKSPSLNLNIQPPSGEDVTVTTSWNMTHIYKEQPSVVKLEGSGFIFKTPVNPLSKNNSDVIYTDRDMRDGSHTVKVDVKNISVAGYNLCTVNDETFRIKGDMYEDYKVD